jgi:ATP-dependent RNA helicase RhlE
MPFEKLRLIEPLKRAIRAQGYSAPTPIQEKALPHVLDGRDLLGCAQTGTGKTAAFALPILQRLYREEVPEIAGVSDGANGSDSTGGQSHRSPKRGRRGRSRGSSGGDGRPIRALILAPTRELAAQIKESFQTYGRNTGLRHVVIFGGVGQRPQTDALRQGVDIVVATPGRLLDLMEQGFVHLDQLEVFVLDEADRMLDMGFIHDIRRVIQKLPADRQTLLFSATMPRAIVDLADTLLQDPVTVKVRAESPAADTVGQVVYRIHHQAKGYLLEHLLADPEMVRNLVFTRTKRGADRVAKRLNKVGIRAEAIHSDKSQSARTRALRSFKDGRTRVLVASDIASRGLDVDQITHVINYDLPDEPETYIHRIGRTGRAGAEGQAISFCSREQKNNLRDIERLLGRSIEVLSHSIKTPATSESDRRGRNGNGNAGQDGGANSGGQGDKDAAGKPGSKKFGSRGKKHSSGRSGGSATGDVRKPRPKRRTKSGSKPRSAPQSS